MEKNLEQGKNADQDMFEPMKKIIVHRTEPIKVTSAPLNHQPLSAA